MTTGMAGLASRRETRAVVENLANAHYSLTSVEEPPQMGLEDSLTNDRLKELEFLFQVFDEDGSGGLDMDEFQHIMRTAVDKNLSDEECDRLFMKVDTNCDGSVDWDELLSYMLLEIQEKDAMKEIHQSKLIPSTMRKVENIERYQNLSDTIIKIEYYPRYNKSDLGSMEPYWAGNGKYVTCTKAGVVNFWSEAMVHIHRHQLPAPKMINRDLDLWVMAMTILQNMSVMAVATTAGTLMFFDINAYSFIKCITVKNLDICITCLTFWTDPEMRDHSILMFGDARGSVMVIDFKDVASSNILFGPSSKFHGSTISFNELLKNPHNMFPGITAYKHLHVHHDMVIDIKFYASLHGFISCCNSNKSAMYVGDLLGGKSYCFNSSKGIQAFDFYPTTNIIVTGGKDGEVRIWNPYVPSKPIMILQGQINPIALVQVDKEREKILTVSVEKEIVIYDMLTQVAVQVIKRKDINMGERALSTACYNHYRKALVLGSNQLALFEHQEEDMRHQKFISHQEPVTCVAYNTLFDQIVSGAINGVVCVWNPNSGAMLMRFTAHKIARRGTEDVDVEVTCMCFDPTERRLITAGRDGSVKIWNFNNGALLRILESNNTSEVTGIVCPPKRIATAGWDRKIQLYVDTYEDVSVRVWDKRHKADITHLAFKHPSVIASGDNNGDILIWNIEGSNISLRLNANVGTKPCSFNDLITAEEWQFLKMLGSEKDYKTKSGRFKGKYSKDPKLDEFLHYNTQQRQQASPVPYILRRSSRARNRGRKLALFDGMPEFEEVHLLQSMESLKELALESDDNLAQDSIDDINNNNNIINSNNDSSNNNDGANNNNDGANNNNDGANNNDDNADNTNSNNNNYFADDSKIKNGVRANKSTNKRKNIPVKRDKSNDIRKSKSDVSEVNASNNNTASNISFLLKQQKKKSRSRQSSSNSFKLPSRNSSSAQYSAVSVTSDIEAARRRIQRRLGEMPETEERKMHEAAKREEQHKYDKYIRRNETAIEKLLFLSKRDSDANTATLIAICAAGWVRFWSVDHRGGLLGQFNAAHVPGDSVHAACVDEAEEYLITGDSEGYIKVWDIAEYCNSSTTTYAQTSEARRKKHQLFPLLFHRQHELLMKHRNQGRHRPPPQNTKPDDTWHAPNLMNSFRAHLDTISGIAYIAKGERIATSSRDCSIRMWTIFGRFIGICGQEVPWPLLYTHDLLEDKSHEDILIFPTPKEGGSEGPKRNRRAVISPKHRDIPGDIRRVASATTLRVISGGIKSNWTRTRAVMMMVVPLNLRLKGLTSGKRSLTGKQRRGSQSSRSDGAGSTASTLNNDEESEYEDECPLPTMSELKANTASKTSTELGKFFLTNRCHHPLPSLPKIRCFNHQVDAFASLPCYKLAPVDNYVVPQTVLDIQDKSKPTMNEATKTDKHKQKSRKGHQLRNAKKFDIQQFAKKQRKTPSLLRILQALQDVSPTQHMQAVKEGEEAKKEIDKQSKTALDMGQRWRKKAMAARTSNS